MTPEDKHPAAVARRRRMRGNGAGYGSGHSTTAEGGYSSPEDDDLNSRVEIEAASPMRSMPGTDDTMGDGMSPLGRLSEVSTSGSAAYAKEYRLKLLHRMLLRNVPLDQIARQLRVSISTVEKDRAELKRMLRQNAKELNIDEMIGNQSGFYDEVAGMALRLASTDSMPTAMRLAAMRTSLAAQNDKSRFYQSAGVFDALQFKRGEDGSEISDIHRLMEQTSSIINNLRGTGLGALDFGQGGDSSNETEIDL